MGEENTKFWDSIKKYYLERFEVSYENRFSFFKTAIKKRVFNAISTLKDDAIKCFALELNEYGIKYTKLAEKYLLNKMKIEDIQEKEADENIVAFHNYYNLYLLRSLKNNKWDLESIRSCLDELYKLSDIKKLGTINDFNDSVIFIILASQDKKDFEKAYDLFYSLNKVLPVEIPLTFNKKTTEKYGKSFRLSNHLALQYLKGNFKSKEILMDIFKVLNEEVTKEWRLIAENDRKEKRISRLFSITDHFNFQKVRNNYLYKKLMPRDVAKSIKGI